MKLIYGLLILLFSSNTLAAIEFYDVKMSDGGSIQVCARFPDPARFPGPRPALMLIMGSGLYDSCRSKTVSGDYSDKIVDEKGVILFSRQKRGLRHDPQTGEFTKDLSQYSQVDLPQLKSDTYEAFEFVLSDPRVDRMKVSAWGGSEGTLLATYIGLHYPQIFEVNLISSMVESFDLLFERQITQLLPKELIEGSDKNKSGTLSTGEISDDDLNGLGLLTFSTIDANLDGVLDSNELASEFNRAALYSLATNNNTFFMSDLFSGGIGVAWIKSAFQVDPLGPQILDLRSPVYLYHGSADINVSVQPVYELDKLAQKNSQTNLHFNYFEGLGHELTREILISTMLDSADRLLQ